MPTKKRGRPKGKKDSKKRKAKQPEATPMQPQSQRQPEGEIIEPKKDIVGDIKSLFGSRSQPDNPQLRILPAPESPQDHSATSSKTSSEFEETASRLEDKYGPGGSQAEVEQGDPLPEGVPEIITPATVEKFLRSFFKGMVKVHGEHWEMSDLDFAVMTPVNTAMINEQVAKLEWFANSQNKALIVWALVMGVLITSRSKTGGKLLEWLMEKLVSLGSKKESPTSKVSPESPAT